MIKATISAFISLLLCPTLVVASPLVTQLDDAHQSSFALDDVRVLVVLGVMSRCPDAILCESVFDQVLKKVESIVHVTLTFIGTTNASEPDYGVTCKHGRDECAGNVQQLCAARYTPMTQWWEFIQCQNFNGLEEIGNPDVALRCAKTTGIDWESSGVGQCTGQGGSGTGREGVHLLQESVNVTRALGIEKSCTILINEKHVCIHDGSWKKCEDGHRPEDFVRQINEEYERLNSNETLIFNRRESIHT